MLIGSNDPTNPKAKVLYLIDFGITRKYIKPDGSHVPFRTDAPFVGNIIFSSVNSFLGNGTANFSFSITFVELSRRDDLESLMYLLTYIATGNLPWICMLSAKSLSVSQHLIKQEKIKIRGEELCKDLPSKHRKISKPHSFHRNIQNALQLRAWAPV